MAFKLNWKIVVQPDGKTRRKAQDDELGLDYIDVEWTHTVGFPADTKEVPVTHPPNPKFETREVGKRTVIKDQVIVSPSVQDSTVFAMLDEKRKLLSASLNVEM